LSILCWRIGIAVAGILLLEDLHAPSFHFGEWPETGSPRELALDSEFINAGGTPARVPGAMTLRKP
jgi:hypothetical protein